MVNSTELFCFIYKEAKEGIFKVIGDGLRRHPEHLNRNAETLGPQLVLNGSSAYIEVHLYFKMSVYKHDISLEFFIFI